MKAKNLPSPRHELPDELDVKSTVTGGYHGSFDSLYGTNPPIRAGRSIKSRSSSTSTSRRSRSDDGTESKKNTKPRNSKKRKKAKNNVEKNVKSTTVKPSAKENNSRRQADVSGSGNKTEMDDYNKLESVITAQLTDMNESSIQKFAQEIVDATMKQLNNTGEKNNTTLTTSKSEEASLLAKIISNSNGNSSVDDIARAFTTVITRNNNALSASSDLNVNLDEVPSPPAKYVKCPPLGTPIIIENTLVIKIIFCFNYGK